MLIYKTTQPEDTKRLGQKLASLIKAGDVITLTGDLGAGKTLLVQGIASALGIDIADVTSPTYTILNVYDARVLPIYHFDLYRLEEAEALYDVGFDEYINGEGLSLVEWADKFPTSMPEELLQIKIERGVDQSERLLTITPIGERYRKLCEELKTIVASGY